MKRLLSFLLAICMIASFFVGVTPQMALAADGVAYVTDAQSLKSALNDETKTELVLSDTIYLDETAIIPSKRSITIRAKDANRAFIRPGSNAWPVGTPLFKILDGATVTFKDITINGAFESEKNAPNLAHGITVEGCTELTLESISVNNCNGGGKSGAGLCISGAPEGQKTREDKGTVLLS